ncbi:hypothetical protein ZTR_11193 [Talaromyces verruculosus]|nr:hypothetical protein ZTR_11193 [Talaromyces verruculosus]
METIRRYFGKADPYGMKLLAGGLMGVLSNGDISPHPPVDVFQVEPLPLLAGFGFEANIDLMIYATYPVQDLHR